MAMDFTEGKIVPIGLEEEMRRSYLNFAMYVIVDRALPDVRDGLKPVQRRILNTMLEIGLRPDRPFKKSARVVGETMAKYHPHGDSAIYDAMVRMGQDFSYRYMLVQGHGNFGSIDGDPPAAMRYCVTGDTLVVTDQGLQRIDQLSPMQCEDINATVLSIGGEQNTASKWFDCGTFPTYRITTRTGYDVTGTENHPLLCCVRDEIGHPVLVWKTVSEIKHGDWLVLDRSSDLWPEDELDLSDFHPQYPDDSRAQRHTLPERLDERLAFILGALTAEGTVRETVIEFTNTYGDFAKQFQAVWAQAFPTCRLHTFAREAAGYGRQPCQQMQVVSTQVTEFIRGVGLHGKSGERTIPETVLRSPKSVVAAFLRALFEGDGCVERSGKRLLRVSYWSKSDDLVRTLQTLLLRFGIVSSRRIDGRSGNHRLLIFGRQNLQRFSAEIGFVSDEKRSALADALSKYSGRALSRTDLYPYLADFVRSNARRGQREWSQKHHFDRADRLEGALPRIAEVMPAEDVEWISGVVQGRYYFDQVATIEDAGEQDVYSVRVDSECHSFVANGFINHNTEARLSRLAMEMLRDIDKDTVDYGPNFDDSLEQPVVLPSRFPNLMVNGATGIAVGMSTNIPPHNLTEVTNAIIDMIDNPEITVEDLMKHIKGPDFPTGGLILGREGIRDAYRTGRGRVVMRAKVRIEQMQGGKQRILVTEIPYMVNKANLVEKIAELHNEKKVDGITALRDESDRTGMRIVIELRRDVNPHVVLNQLYKHSQLQETFGVIMLSLVNGEPKILDLKGMLHHYIDHQREVVTRRTKFELRKAEDRAHILEGYRIALDHIDEIIQLIRNAKSDQDAKVKLMERFGLSERQSVAILDMQLRRLTGLEREKIESEYQELLQTIARLKEILGDEQLLFGLIKGELTEIRDKYGDERRTEITSAQGEIDVEDLIAEEDIVVTLTHHGYVKRLPLTAYRSQKRGGRGVTALSTRAEDFVEHLFITTTHTYIVFFTNKGRVFRLRAHEIPEAGRNARGTAIVNLLQIEPGEYIQAAIPIKEYDDDRYLFISTRNGTVKKTVLSEFDSSYSGLIALTLDDDDEVIGVQLTDGNQDMLIVTAGGQAIRFKEEDVRAMGRAARGVRGITLDKGDAVVGMDVVYPDRELLVVTRNGFGKRTPLSEYRITGRGGKGIRTIQKTDRNGPIAGVKVVREDDDVMLISHEGIMIRFSVKDVSRLGRSTQGVRLMRLGDNDHVVALAQVVSKEEESEDQVSLL